MSNAVTMQTIAESRAYRLRWWILLVLAVSILVIVLSSSMINIALPTLQRELGTTMTDLQWIINAYMLTLAGLMLTMGALGDRWGRSVMLNAGICVFGFANLGAVFAETSVQLIICRGVMGLGGAMILPATLAIITSVFPEEERGRAIGIWAGLNSIGIALGPIIGGLLVQHFRWNSIFLLNLPFALVAMVAGMLLIPVRWTCRAPSCLSSAWLP
jgi:DHA2 family multidrug resistance protein-like MFS transporter